MARFGRGAFSLMGAVLALGAPVGWLAIRWVQGVAPTDEILHNPFLMLYLLVPTTTVFAGTGFILGVQWERLCDTNRRLSELSKTDMLTGLPNARSFWEDVHKECLRAARHGRMVFLLMIDIDHFKFVNDTYGHLVGDELLKATARAMSDLVRKDEGIYRVGGEEFVAILVDSTREQARMVAERLREAVAGAKIPAALAGTVDDLGVTVSIGVAGRHCDAPLEPQEIYDWADKALYAAKRAGRNRVSLAPEAEPEQRPAA